MWIGSPAATVTQPIESVHSPVAGASVAGISVAGISVAGISVAGISVAGISVAGGASVVAGAQAVKSMLATTSNESKAIKRFILLSPPKCD
jgi:hypothetical protein